MNLDEYQNLAEPDAGNASLAGSIAQPRPVSDAEVAYKLTENIPVGTYTIELNEAGEPFFSFCSSRWLTMLQLDRAAVMADPALAFRCVHPDDVEGFVAINAFVMRNQTPFFWRGRIVVGGEIRWVVIESLPRERPGLGPLWEGVMIDITREVEMQEALERSATEHQQHLRQKLRTSLTAAGIAHEINQPLSRLLLRAQLGATEPEKAVAALKAIEAIRDADSPERQAIVSVATSTSEVRLTVSDTGPGWSGAAPRIMAGELGELPLGSSKTGGSGLGLSMVQMIMENHAGSIALQTAAGGGAEVVLTFPRIA
jgi:signal transduction histidine kinase